MPLHRPALPQLSGALFATDGGLETTLVFHQGLELPFFAAFPLLADEAGRARLKAYFESYLDTARALGLGIVLESATWRASADWAERLGIAPGTLEALNRRAIEDLVQLREQRQGGHPGAIVISGNIGPRHDGYVVRQRMSADQAQAYHAAQVQCFAGTEADLVSAFTLNYVDEAVGIARAAQAAGMPVVLSFTLETDGRLPDGTPLHEAIEATDAATDAAPAYYMLNCAHPLHVEPALRAAGAWRDRLRGLRANASRLSHAQLDAATTLDAGDPDELAQGYRRLRHLLPSLAVAGGCCGTDARHVRAVCAALASP